MFSLGVSSVIRWVQRHRATGSFSPKPIGGSRGYRIDGENRTWLLARIKEKADLTLEELRRELLAERGLAASYGAVWRFCEREALTFKNTPHNKSGLTSPRRGPPGARPSPASMSAGRC